MIGVYFSMNPTWQNQAIPKIAMFGSSIKKRGPQAEDAETTHGCLLDSDLTAVYLFWGLL